MKSFAQYGIAFLVGAVSMIAALFLTMKFSHYQPEPSVVVKRDTVVFHDTVRIEKPVPRYINTVDTIRVPVIVTEHDTIYVSLPKEEKTYADSTYKVTISGYQPCLEMIEVYPTTVKITEKENIYVASRKRWGVGVQVGYGAALNGKQVVLSPYVGIGVSYHFIRW